MNKYTHLELNREINAIAGYYIPQKEVRLEYDGREVLYVVGQATIECSCCACGSWEYALVPGYIRNWQNEKNDAGLPVSEIEPVRDEEAQGKISRTITEKEAVPRVEFW